MGRSTKDQLVTGASSFSWNFNSLEVAEGRGDARGSLSQDTAVSPAAGRHVRVRHGDRRADRCVVGEKVNFPGGSPASSGDRIRGSRRAAFVVTLSLFFFFEKCCNREQTHGLQGWCRRGPREGSPRGIGEQREAVPRRGTGGPIFRRRRRRGVPDETPALSAGLDSGGGLSRGRRGSGPGQPVLHVPRPAENCEPGARGCPLRLCRHGRSARAPPLPPPVHDGVPPLVVL